MYKLHNYGFPSTRQIVCSEKFWSHSYAVKEFVYITVIGSRMFSILLISLKNTNVRLNLELKTVESDYKTVASDWLCLVCRLPQPKW